MRYEKPNLEMVLFTFDVIRTSDPELGNGHGGSGGTISPDEDDW